MKIYTKTGDDGKTSLFDNSRVWKSNQRIMSYGSVDELNSTLGVAISMDLDPQIKEILIKIQNDLFVVGSDLANPDMTNTKIDKWYNAGLKNGAIGGKIVGAGGGGFLMFYAKNKKKLRYQMLKEGLEEVLFNFDFEGTKIIVK